MERILKMYEEATEEHISELTSIINNDIGILDVTIPETGKDLLRLSSKKLMDRWKSGAKYLRTINAVKAISNYPEEILKLSVSIDALVNNLDDVLDETLDEQAKALYIVEIIKLLAMFNYQNADQRMRNSIAKFFNKLISIALLESFYYKMIKTSHNTKNPLEHVVPLYDCRSLDMDIFVEIPMIKLFGGANNEDVINAARCFRALNLLKKDIKDFQHDKEQGQSTIMTIFHTDKSHMRSIIEAMVGHYLNKSRNFPGGGEFKDIIDNYKNMAESEAKEVSNATEDLLAII